MKISKFTNLGQKLLKSPIPLPFRSWTEHANQYTQAGRPATRTWARLVAGQRLVTSYAYNAYNAAGDLADSGSALAIEYTDATVDVSISRDRLGQINQIIDAAGTHTLTYHANGERETEAHVAGVLAGWSVTRGLDGLLRRNGLTLKEGSTVKNAVSYGYGGTSG